MQPSTGTSELAKGFRQHYRGDAAKGFLEYLKDNEKKWREPVNQYYGKFCSIVQSSGTGKTRLLFEVSICHSSIIRLLSIGFSSPTKML